jgi:C4-dicarboxylate-specific signal transduction histidine kinase
MSLTPDRDAAAPSASAESVLASSAPAPIVRYARKMAHDLNNYVAVMRTYSELLLADLPPGPVHDDITEIHRAADAMVSYVARVARFARTGSMRLERQPLEPIVRKALAKLDPMPGVPAVALTGDLRATVAVDAEWLVEVLVELVHNAREATRGEGAVTVAVSVDRAADAPMVMLTVRDNGPGFAPEVEADAEEPFVTTKAGVRGAGMGLAIAAAFAEGSGGRLLRMREHGSTAVALALPLTD